MDLAPGQSAFHIAEFAALKKEAGDAAKTAAAHFRWAAVASAAVLAWISTEGADVDIPLTVFLVPAAITLLMGGLSAALYARIALIGRYLRTLETALGRKPEFGWEDQFAKGKRMLAALTAIGWLALFGADLYAGLALQAAAAGDGQYETRQATTT